MNPIRASSTDPCGRALLTIACGFLALTSVAGGIGLMTGAIAPGGDLLVGSLFTDYTVPGLVLLTTVGATALVATVLFAFSHPAAPVAAGIAGTLIVCFEVVEVWVIGSPPGLARNLQIFYVLLGSALVGAALAGHWFSGNRGGRMSCQDRGTDETPCVDGR